MSEVTATESTTATKDAEQPPVQATVSITEAPQEVKLTAQAPAPAAAATVVATAAVNAIVPEDVKVTAVSATAQPTVSNQPTVTNQPTETKGVAPVGVTVSKDGAIGDGGQPKLQTPAAAAAADPIVKSFQPQTDDFYRSIFYFSGMGRVIGSALAAGVYVDEKNRRNAIDPEEISLHLGRKEAGSGTGEGGGELIKSARNQAVNLSADFRRLQSLLESLPTFTDAVGTRSSSGVRVDEPIHGEIYFRSERPDQYQQQRQQQLASQRTPPRQTYIIDPSPSVSIHHQQNGHLIDVPWNYQNNF